VLPLVSPTFEQLETTAKVCSVRGFACYLYDKKTELIKTTSRNLASVLYSGIPADVLPQDEDVPRRRHKVIHHVRWNKVLIISDILDSCHTD
jgi:hypothetical protein